VASKRPVAREEMQRAVLDDPRQARQLPHEALAAGGQGRGPVAQVLEVNAPLRMYRSHGHGHGHSQSIAGEWAERQGQGRVTVGMLSAPVKPLRSTSRRDLYKLTWKMRWMAAATKSRSLLRYGRFSIDERSSTTYHQTPATVHAGRGTGYRDEVSGEGGCA